MQRSRAPLNFWNSLWLHARVPVAMGLSLGMLVGCGNAMYAVQANRAAAKLEEARHAGAEADAPYEYWYAKLHLEKASSEASEADYSDAIHLAEVAEEHATRAIRLANEAKRGAGR